MIWKRSNSGIERRRKAFAASRLACLCGRCARGLRSLTAGGARTSRARCRRRRAALGSSQPEGGDDERNLVAAFGGTYADEKAESLLNTVATRLVAGSTEPAIAYKITILNSPTVNAFSLPDGHLYVTRGAPGARQRTWPRSPPCSRMRWRM